ncbi:Chromosome-partitioning protein ParB [Commensalibacter sp. Nvir]|uniref:ParB/RepB/Spo0J family partition protein n=1 Tax=Commensalibacter sp. Nvir TaxID=3069817 RepID=UPI002D6F7F4E|nr:Chromosome-partitioning protein ParB [Commensalibacter sp. Nvir]
MKTGKNQEKKHLGRGLAALLGANIVSQDKEPQLKASQFKTQTITETITLSLGCIEAGPFQPRQIMQSESLQELANSLKHHGILQPLLVREKPSHKGKYQIIAGERRWRAAQLANLYEIPVRICHFSDKDAMAVALVENLQRADLNVIEEAEGFSKLLNEFSLTQEELAKIIGKSRPYITNNLRLLQLPEKIKVYLKEGKLSAGHARALLMHSDPVKAAVKVLDNGLTVRQTEALVRKNTLQKHLSTELKESTDPEIKLLEKDLCCQLGLNVHVKFDGEGGFIKIDYKSLEEFDNILALLKHKSNF